MPLRLLAALMLAGIFTLPRPLAADTAGPGQKPLHAYAGVRTLLSTGSTVTGEPIHYPSGAPARITATEITLQPGQQTGWHTHPVPLVGYLLDGELTVDYGPKGKRVYRKGDALVEAMNESHNGRNTGQGPTRILAIFIGVEGSQGSTAAPPPAR